MEVRKNLVVLCSSVNPWRFSITQILGEYAFSFYLILNSLVYQKIESNYKCRESIKGITK